MNQTLSYSPRQVAYVAVFGGLWGALECTLGAVLHVMQVPLAGLLMTALGIGCGLTGYRQAPGKGMLLQIGAVAAIIKLLSIGGVRLSPFVGILGEAFCAQMILNCAGPSLLTFALAGAAACLMPLLLPIINTVLLAGVGLYEVLVQSIGALSEFLGIGIANIWVLLALYSLLHIGVGLISGVLAWRLSDFVTHRMGDQPLS